jgi:pimeloyl-ACP methyl ester carboxylesterase
LESLAGALTDQYELFLPAFPGHAGEQPDGAFSIAAFASWLLTYMEAQSLSRPFVFGYSMGGYVALLAELQRPGLFAGIATLATKFAWTAESAAKEVRLLQPEVMEEKIPAFAAALKARHAPLDWKDVVRNTANLMRALGANPLLDPEDLSRLETPVLLLLGDRDTMVSQQETTDAYRSIPRAQFGVLPGTPHPIEKCDASLLAHLLHRFFNQQDND